MQFAERVLLELEIMNVERNEDPSEKRPSAMTGKTCDVLSVWAFKEFAVAPQSSNMNAIFAVILINLSIGFESRDDIRFARIRPGLNV